MQLLISNKLQIFLVVCSQIFNFVFGKLVTSSVSALNSRPRLIVLQCSNFEDDIGADRPSANLGVAEWLLPGGNADFVRYRI